jgi:hypothetical protein
MRGKMGLMGAMENITLITPISPISPINSPAANSFFNSAVSRGGTGRDHNPFCFTNWLCGDGIKGGVMCGASDKSGYKPQDRNNPTQVYDIHATILHLLGIDHTRLTFYHNGIQRRLTDVHGHVIQALLS